MSVSRFPLLLLLLCLFQYSQAQHKLSRVTFPIDAEQTIRDLAKAGIDLTHGSGLNRNAFTTEIQDYELDRFKQLGIRYETIIDDVAKHRAQSPHSSRGGEFLSCQNHSFDETIPKNFELGNVGGFFSMSEILDNLDAMVLYYPGLVSVRRPIGDIKTWGNNPIYWVRISDNAETDENEPEILFTGLHHARELVSVSANIYFMWYLLENYSKDPVIHQIIDNTELYFVPVVNPDGMLYNLEGWDPVNQVFTRNHRKNLRDNDGDGKFDPSIDGVDLNRNYGHMWGFDDEGSSGFEGSDTYRGPAPFSEPETQAIQTLCNQHDFKFALNYHSYGDVLIYPWGFDNTETPDSASFGNYAELLTQLNGYVYGLGEETVDYRTNGDSDDWMYGAANIMAMTPEIGDDEDGFYPGEDRIIPLCQSTLQMNLLAARLVNSLVRITDESPKFIQPGVNPLDLEFNRYGLLDGEVEISFHALSSHITQLPSPIHLNLDKFQPHTRNLSFTVDNQLSSGSSVKFEIICKQGNYEFRDTLEKTRAEFSTLVSDKGDLNNWDRSGGQEWGTTTAQYKSGPVSITDSPDGDYLPNSHEAIVLNEQIDLRDVTSAYAQFWARWDIEDHYDYVVFQASTDGESWENLCGEQSRLGSIFQLYEQPLYDGRQVQWVFETTDLSSYIGHVIQLRFLLVSDGFIHRDGFYFDDFKVITINQENVATTDPQNAMVEVYPNPARQKFSMHIPDLQAPSVILYNALGQVMYRADVTADATTEVDATGWPVGLYMYTLLSSDKPVRCGKVEITE